MSKLMKINDDRDTERYSKVPAGFFFCVVTSYPFVISTSPFEHPPLCDEAWQKGRCQHRDIGNYT